MDYILPLSDKVIKVLRGCLEKAKPYTAEERETLNYPEVGAFFIDRLLTCLLYTSFDAVENRRQYKVRRLANRLKEAPACLK